MKTRSMYKPEQTPLDRISALPQPITETILCLLSTEEAARTGILSREWRYKWTNIPKLRFNLRKSPWKQTSDEASVIKNMDLHDLHQILLLHQGPIHELTLSMENYWAVCDGFEFDQIILHVSRNHIVKKLTLDGSRNIWNKLPNSVFTLHHLTDLYLCRFDIDHPSILNGFCSLEKLELSYVKISTKTVLHLLSNCPSLKNLRLRIWESSDRCTINELLKCLPVIEHLTILGDVFQWLDLDSVLQELPNSLIHLKYLRLSVMCQVENYGLDFLFVLLKCSPNLETMDLEIEWGPHELPALKDRFSNVWLAHLKELDICSCSKSHEKEFVKFILARSPKLNKVTIFTC